MTPRWTTTAAVQQIVPLPQSSKLTASVHLHYQSSAYTGRYFLPTELQGGYAITNVDVNFSTARERFTAGLYLHNVFDKVANNFSFPIPLSAMETGLLLPPRTIGGRISVHL